MTPRRLPSRALFLYVASICLASALSAQALTGAVRNVGPGWIATIPFAPDGGGSIFLSVAINGQAPRWWALDSGSRECIVERGVGGDPGGVVAGGETGSG